jgi:hypothetical protein
MTTKDLCNRIYDNYKVTWNDDLQATVVTDSATGWTLSYVDSGYAYNNTSTAAHTHTHSKPEPKKEEAPKDAKNLLVTKEKRLKVKNCKDGFVDSTKDIMPNISDISVKSDGENSTVIFVTFTDGKREKAILDKDDEFSLEHGLTIIMLEKLLSDKGVDGKSVHNKLVGYAMKFYDKQEKNKAKEKIKQIAEKEKRERIKEKVRKRKLKQSEAEREYQIEIMAEAYRRAMKKEN